VRIERRRADRNEKVAPLFSTSNMAIKVEKCGEIAKRRLVDVTKRF
jgi:hypothetical protein